MFKHELRIKDIIRFRNSINIKNDNECWPWIKGIDGGGYGYFTVRSIMYKAHRASYYFANGCIDNNLVCCHSCDNKICVNPLHLWLGTLAENNKDRHQKGRSKNGITYGENHPLSKLKNNDILFIRNNYDSKIWTLNTLAKKFDVCPTKIKDIITYKSWRYL